MNYIFLGPPGSGKGTQAKKLAERLKLFYFGTGDLMREEAERGTEFGKIFKSVWDQGKGKLVDEEIVEKFVEGKIKEKAKSAENLVFDGFPRTIRQTKLLEKHIPINKETFKVININVSTQSLTRRMETRRVCESCDKIFFKPEENGVRNCDVCGGKLVRRQEDAPEVIRERIKVYEDETKPLIAYYREKGILIDIDGEPPIEKVTEEINQSVN